jgi:hypothetical protein
MPLLVFQVLIQVVSKQIPGINHAAALDPAKIELRQKTITIYL